MIKVKIRDENEDWLDSKKVKPKKKTADEIAHTVVERFKVEVK